MKPIELNINGTKRSVEVEPDRNLLSVLRDDLDMTGTKYGCGESQCGACTVLADNQAIRSCVTPARAVTGKRITTIEGLSSGGQLHPLQEAFLEVGAFQCGYCTPGMIMSGVALLNKNPNPDEREIVRFMQSNVCRCGTYSRIVLAIRNAARAMKEGSK